MRETLLAGRQIQNAGVFDFSSMNTLVPLSVCSSLRSDVRGAWDGFCTRIPDVVVVLKASQSVLRSFHSLSLDLRSESRGASTG